MKANVRRFAGIALGMATALIWLGIWSGLLPSWPLDFLVLSGAILMIAFIIAVALIFLTSIAFLLYRRRSRKTTPPLWKFFRWYFLTSFLLLILCVMLNITNTSTQPDARPSNIVSELRNMKAAARMYQADYGYDLAPGANHIELLRPYFDNPQRYDSGLYALYAAPQVWWVGFDFNAHYPDRAVREKLEHRASNRGIYGSARLDAPPLSWDEGSRYTEKDSVAWMTVELPPTSRDKAP
ncbi:MAG: hypothetical protein LBQ42_02435 [Synergistaceae bacterium]|nr:hypothetical protein [Synergistaceae bacterium]